MFQLCQRRCNSSIRAAIVRHHLRAGRGQSCETLGRKAAQEKFKSEHGGKSDLWAHLEGKSLGSATSGADRTPCFGASRSGLLKCFPDREIDDSDVRGASVCRNLPSATAEGVDLTHFDHSYYSNRSFLSPPGKRERLNQFGRRETGGHGAIGRLLRSPLATEMASGVRRRT